MGSCVLLFQFVLLCVFLPDDEGGRGRGVCVRIFVACCLTVSHIAVHGGVCVRKFVSLCLTLSHIPPSYTVLALPFL